MRSQPTTERGRSTVQRVLDAACVLFASQGIRATTLDEVGALSGTGRGQLYLYFTSKADLVAEVIGQQVERVLDAQQPLLGTMSTAAEVREWCTVAAQQYAADGPVRCPIGSLVHELGGQDATARVALAAGFTRWRAALAAGMRRVQDRGELAPAADPDGAAAALLTAYQGGVLLADAANDRDVLRLALEAVAAMALVGPAT